MNVIDKYKFILTLSNETELSVDEAEKYPNVKQKYRMELIKE